MPTVYPPAIDNLNDPNGLTELADPTRLHSVQHTNVNGAVEALETKLGTGGGAPPATAAVLRRTATGASDWGPVQSSDLTAGMLGGSAVEMLLNYNGQTAADFTDHTNTTWTINTPNYLAPAQSFVVQASTSIIEIAVRVGIFNVNAPATTCEVQSYMEIDGPSGQRVELGSCSANNFGNPFSGAQPVFLTGLAAGTHTVRVVGWGNQTTSGWHLRAKGQPQLEHFNIQVIEHKIGVGIKGDIGPSAQTAGGPKIQLNYTLPSDIGGGAIALYPTWTTVIPPQNFTVDAASSLIGVSIQAAMMMGGVVNTMTPSRLLVDGVTAIPLGGSDYHTAASQYSNALSGGSTAWLGSLSAGTHSVAVQFSGYNTNTALVYIRPSIGTEWFRMQVIEHKLGGLAWTMKGGWSSATAYVLNDVVSFNGSAYVCLLNHTNQSPPTQPTYWSLLVAKGDTGLTGTSFIWRGPWAAGTSYAVNDVVSQGGATYICTLATLGNDPTTDGGVHWAVMVAPGSMVNPMTTASDVIVGGTSGAPIRLAKGANDRVFGVDASGVLGYKQVTGADIASSAALGVASLAATGPVSGGQIGTPSFATGNYFNGGNTGQGDLRAYYLRASDLSTSALTVTGGLSLPTGSVTGTMLQDRTIGAVDIATGTIGANEVAGRALTGYNAVAGTFGAIGAGAWSYTNLTITMSGLWPGVSVVYGTFIVSVAMSTDTAIAGAGVGFDSTAGPSYYQHAHAPGGGGWAVAFTVPFLHLATAGAHAYYGLVYCNIGTISAYTTCWINAVSLHR